MTEVQPISDPYEIQFPKLNLTFHVDPTAFTVFGIDIQWYGVIITFGLILAFIYCYPKMKKFGISQERGIDAIIGGILGGIVGARAYYVLSRWDNYKGDIKAIINTRNGGLAIYGGIIGAFAVGLVICRIRKVKAFPMLDVVVMGFLMGQGIGRWGNFVNQEAFGSNTDSILGMTGGTVQESILRNIANGSITADDMNAFRTVHPCFFYESMWCLLGFLIFAVFSNKRKYDGQLLLMYMTWYGAERFVVEGFRTDSLMAGNLRISQALSAVIFTVSAIIQIVMIFRVKRDPERYVLYCNTEESKALIKSDEDKKDSKKTDGEKESEVSDRNNII